MAVLRHWLPNPLPLSVLTGFVLLLHAASCPGVVTTDSTYILVDGQRQFIIGTYDPPPGLSRDEIRAAGFDFLFDSMRPDYDPSGALGFWQAFRLGSSLHVAPGHDPDYLIDIVNRLESEADLLAWHGPDEPAWGGDPLDPIYLQNGYDLLRTHDDYFGEPRPVWINHACRGTDAHPDSFEILRPYVECADIFSMDIYPVPESYEHSILSNKSISCVGEHTDILIDLLSDEQGRQTKPAWMVLQGFSWTDFFVTSEWYGTQQSTFDIGRIARAASGDVSGDGMTDLVYLYRGEDALSGPEWIQVSCSAGDRFTPPRPWAEVSTDSLPWDRVGEMDCGDVDDDGFDDVVLLFHPDDESGVLRVFRSDGSTLTLSDTDPEDVRSLLRPSNISAFGLGDFDGSGADEAVVAALTDTLGASRQSLWVIEPGVPPQEWLEIPSADVPLKGIMKFHAGDYSGDGQDDVCVVFEDGAGTLQVKVAASQRSLFSPAVSWWDTTTAEFPLDDFHGTTSQDLNGDGRTDLLLFYSQENHQLNPQWFVALLSDGTRFYTERWGASAIGNYQFSRQQFPMGGDFNADGFGEFAVLFDREIPVQDPYQVIRAALSYGEKFGVPGPTYQESRFMAYDAIIHGATGIVWWGIWHTGGPYAVWRAVSEVAAELNTLRSFLVYDNSPDAVVSDAPAIETMLKEVGPYACLIAANRADSTLEVALTGTPVGEYDVFDVMFESRALAPEGSTLHDQFGPYDVHVYLGYGGTHSDPWPPAGEVSICPNPFSSSTLFTLRSNGTATLEVDIYDIRGRRIRRITGRAAQTGLHSIEWDGKNSRGERVSTGVYLCRFKVGDRVFSRKVVCLQ